MKARQAGKSNRTAVVVLSVVAGALALAICAGVVGGMVLGIGSEKDPGQASSKSGAQTVVDAIAAKWPAPNPADNTDGCKGKAGDTVAGCVSRVTTDAVTVTEFPDEATAAHWAKGMSKVGDNRQVGRYMLSWTARDQAMTSDEARADMVTIAKGLAG